MLHGFFRKIAPLAAMAMATGLAGCDGMDIKINDMEGVPLADLDMSGDPPTEVALAGPDTVVITDGDTLAITVEGDQAAVDAMRFSLKDGTLGILRADKSWKDTGTATVRVTMPSPKSLTLLASGKIEAASLSGDASVQILGSGKVAVASVATDSLDVTIAGSGSYDAAGTTKSMDMTVAGSGGASMAALKVDGAKISILGSGSAEFASEGDVSAEMMGSGNVTIIGTLPLVLIVGKDQECDAGRQVIDQQHNRGYTAQERYSDAQYSPGVSPVCGIAAVWLHCENGTGRRDCAGKGRRQGSRSGHHQPIRSRRETRARDSQARRRTGQARPEARKTGRAMRRWRPRGLSRSGRCRGGNAGAWPGHSRRTQPGIAPRLQRGATGR